MRLFFSENLQKVSAKVLMSYLTIVQSYSERVLRVYGMCLTVARQFSTILLSTVTVT